MTTKKKSARGKKTSAAGKSADRSSPGASRRSARGTRGSNRTENRVPPTTLVTVAESEDTFVTIEKALVDLWSVVNELSRVRPPHKKYYRVTIFGSSRMRAGDPVYEDVRRLASELSHMGCDIVTGGGPGLMQAANEGALEGDPTGKTRSFGLTIELPLGSEEPANPYVERLFAHKTFFTRLAHFVRLSSAFIVVPGGIGTTLETFMIWQLLQVRHIRDLPLIFLGPQWKSLVSWTKRYMLKHDPHLANPEDLAIPTCVETVDHAVEAIRGDYERFLQGRAEAKAL